MWIEFYNFYKPALEAAHDVDKEGLRAANFIDAGFVKVNRHSEYQGMV